LEKLPKTKADCVKKIQK